MVTVPVKEIVLEPVSIAISSINCVVIINCRRISHVSLHLKTAGHVILSDIFSYVLQFCYIFGHSYL